MKRLWMKIHMKHPMMIYPAIHYCMGGIWVDYELMTTIPGIVLNR